MENIKIRKVQADDAAALLAIYAPYVKETAISFEYEVPTLDEFMQRMQKIQKMHPYLVAELDDRPVGYAYAGQFQAREAYAWDVEVTIYVDHGLRKSGIGRLLYETLERALSAQGILNVNACIAFPAGECDDEFLTKNSVQFHEHMGYRMVGRFTQCGYKLNRWYDMVWMEKHLGAHTQNQPPAVPFSDVDFKF